MKNSIYVDDRNADQMKSHTILITATDRFMSNWGQASAGASKVAWACRPDQDYMKVYEWVKSRNEMKYVDLKMNGKWNPKNFAHLHIYVVGDNHPALR